MVQGPRRCALVLDAASRASASWSIPLVILVRPLQILYSIRSERQLKEQMDYNLLFLWFVGLGIDDAVWIPTVFTKKRDRLLTRDMCRKIMAAILPIERWRRCYLTSISRSMARW